MGNPGTGTGTGTGTASKKKNEVPDSELHAAARAGDLSAVQLICSSDPHAVNSRDKHSRTPLHLAAWSGHAEIVSYLCKNKADVGASAMDDTAAIHFASQKGHIEVVRILLSFGVSIKCTNRKGMTPLHFAIQASHLELVKYLIRKGANLSSKNKTGETPLDLVKSEEMRSLINQLERSLKSKDQTTRSETDEFPLKSSNAEDFHAHQADADIDTDGKREKRKGDDDIIRDSLPVPDAKKTKVSLAHLLAEDDIEEEL